MAGLLWSLAVSTIALAIAVGAQAQPLNDDCTTATVITSALFGDTVDTTAATDGPSGLPGCSCVQPKANDVW